MWLISKAMMDNLENSLCSQEQEEESLEGSCLDGELSAQLSGSHTQLAYLPPDKMTAFSRLSRSGMTFKPLTANRGEELLMLFRAGFPVRTSVRQEKEPGLMEADQACGSTWLELSVKYDRNTHSWRTHHCLFQEDLPWSSVTLTKWGMMRSGVLFQHPTAERPISGTDAGCWVGIPTASMSVPSEKYGAGSVPTPRALAEGKLRGNEKWPTPQSSDHKSRHRTHRRSPRWRAACHGRARRVLHRGRRRSRCRSGRRRRR